MRKADGKHILCLGYILIGLQCKNITAAIACGIMAFIYGALSFADYLDGE